MAEEAGLSHSEDLLFTVWLTPAERVPWRPEMKIFDESGTRLATLGQIEPGAVCSPLTEEERQRACERRQSHRTKRWFEKQLLAIVNDESVPAKERHEALLHLGRVRGYHRAPKSKRSGRNAISCCSCW